MRALVLQQPNAISSYPLVEADLPVPVPGDHELLLKPTVCGVCHTDLHIVEGDLKLPRLPITPGHQVVATVAETGKKATRFKAGDRVGVPWLHKTCGQCRYCQEGRENLCEEALFTGLQVPGGFAEYLTAPEAFVYELPDSIEDVHLAPLLCAGIIGYRSLRLCEIHAGQKLGLIGFGASAHIAIQIAVYWGCEVFVFSRSASHRRLALDLGAVWAGTSTDPVPEKLDGAILFAPAGKLVPGALEHLARGATLAINAIHLSPIPKMSYDLIYHERVIRSVANATREDAKALLALAGEIPLRTEVEVFSLSAANQVLEKVKNSSLRAAGVLRINDKLQI